MSEVTLAIPQTLNQFLTQLGFLFAKSKQSSDFLESIERNKFYTLPLIYLLYSISFFVTWLV